MLETRIDLTEQKLRLFSHLGPVKSKTYWDTLKKFLIAKLSKREFDIITRDLLDKDDGWFRFLCFFFFFSQQHLEGTSLPSV